MGFEKWFVGLAVAGSVAFAQANVEYRSYYSAGQTLQVSSLAQALNMSGKTPCNPYDPGCSRVGPVALAYSSKRYTERPLYGVFLGTAPRDGSKFDARATVYVDIALMVTDRSPETFCATIEWKPALRTVRLAASPSVSGLNPSYCLSFFKQFRFDKDRESAITAAEFDSRIRTGQRTPEGPGHWITEAKGKGLGCECDVPDLGFWPPAIGLPLAGLGVTLATDIAWAPSRDAIFISPPEGPFVVAVGMLN